ncbi:MAG TPA: ABC transporter ATP-binding protein [Gaiellaceae bacterium]|nr:ABC transporter ATP-binding protein [Gaiellaceae bacterium]
MDTLHVRLSHPLRSFRVELSLDVGRETVALVGPSGAGKTSVLRAVAGLLRPERGRIAFGDELWFDSETKVRVPPERRSVGLVFQEYALFPHMTVAQNVAYGGRDGVAGLLETLGIAALAGARPDELSGGERQRVALARALARNPGVLLLDEPLTALDSHTRAHVRAELGEVLARLRLPTLLVTHDFQDAAALATRVGVLVEGRIVQVGSPAELVATPASPFVADFTGGNLLRGVARPGSGGLTEVTLDDGTRIFSTDRLEGHVGAVVYPWEVAVAHEAPTDSAQNHVTAPIASLVPVANRVRVRIGPLTAEITAASAERLGLRQGEPVVASFKATGTRLVPLA